MTIPRFTDLYKSLSHVLDLESLFFTGRLQPADKFLNRLTRFAEALSVAQSTVAKRTFAIKSFQNRSIHMFKTVVHHLVSKVEARLPTEAVCDCHPNKSASSNFACPHVRVVPAAGLRR